MRYMKRFAAGVLCASMLLNMNGIASFAATNENVILEEQTTEETAL